MAGWVRALTEGLIVGWLKVMMHAEKRRTVKAALFLFCGLAAMGSLAFIAVGTYVSLREYFTPWLSGLIIGGAILALSIVGSLVLWLFMGREADLERNPTGQSETEQARLDNAAYLGEIIGRQLSRRGIRTTDVMIAALVAGAVLGVGPVLRSRRRHRHDD